MGGGKGMGRGTSGLSYAKSWNLLVRTDRQLHHRTFHNNRSPDQKEKIASGDSQTRNRNSPTATFALTSPHGS
jgi:hypothetical protein